MIQYTARITSQDTPRVGGRNLLVGERFSKETTPSKEISILPILNVIEKNNLIGETVTWSFDLKCDKAYSFNVYQLGTIWFTSYKNATVEAGEWKRFSFTGVVRDTGNPTGSRDRDCTLTVYGGYGSGYYPITRRHKLERGTVATDWTPAPEDLDDRISTVNTSLTALASTLLDPDKGEIHKLTSQLESHKTDTDKNFGELSNHPLTIDKDGYWQIWSIKDSKYVTTQYQSRGDKGDKPVITLNSKYQLLADGVLLSQQSLKGRDGRNPSPEEVLGTSRFAELLGGEVTSQIVPVAQDLATTNSNITRASNYAIALINGTQHQLCDLQVLGMSDGGVVEVKRQVSCVSYDYLTPSLGTTTNPPQPPQPKYTTQQIPLTLRSSHDALSKQVSNLQTQLTSCSQRLTATKQELAKLKADTAITPVLNTSTRKRGSTLYPLYGDWLLTSDAEEQYISFSGLSAEVGRSIYIQTRKRAYLYSSGHSFHGLPGTSTQGNRWLSNNTTYRFVRAGATDWLVTASASPYPWT